MVAFYLIQAVLLAGLFYLLWKIFGHKLFQTLTHDPELEISRKIDRVRERMAALPTLEEAAASSISPGPVEVLRADYERKERELLAALERVRREKKRSS